MTEVTTVPGAVGVPENVLVAAEYVTPAGVGAHAIVSESKSVKAFPGRV